MTAFDEEKNCLQRDVRHVLGTWLLPNCPATGMHFTDSYLSESHDDRHPQPSSRELCSVLLTSTPSVTSGFPLRSPKPYYRPQACVCFICVTTSTKTPVMRIERETRELLKGWNIPTPPHLLFDVLSILLFRKTSVCQ